MDLLELEDMNSGCGGENCSLASGFPESCSTQDWEEPMFGLIELVCVTAIYIPLMIFGLLGNILTIVVVWLRPHMRSSTYLYLSSMAVSDMLILLLLPLDLYKLWRPRPWPLGDLACKLTMFLSECCTFCTILHITFLSLERYLAVCWPITAKTLVTRRRTRTIIGCLWLGAAVSAAPVLIMVGVEEVGGEDFGLGGWREDGGWTGREAEQGFIIGGREREGGHIGIKYGGQEGTNWEEKGKNEWGGRVEELEGFGGKEEKKMEKVERDERRQGDEGEAEEEVKMEAEEELENNMKEDEGGGRDDSVEGPRGEIDTRECRWTHYAVSSGLVSAMMILSNLYFLVPLCILGLVYSLIGRTLWLRTQISRRDQSHRHTIKMLGVIVLVFVLCWLPFQLGRTIFSFSIGSERQDAYTDTYTPLDTLPDVSMDRNINIHTSKKPMSQSESDMHLKTPSETGKVTAHAHAESDETFCDIFAKAKAQITTHTDVDTHLAAEETDKGTQSDDMTTDKHLNTPVASHTRGPHINADVSTHHQDPRPETATTTHTETHVGTQVSNSNTSFDTDTNESKHTNKSGCTELQTSSSMQNWAPICINSQNTVSANTHAVKPTDLYSTQNDTPFNNTYVPPDTHSYFLYYLLQYFNLVSTVLFYLSAVINPLLYNLMSARYRHAVHSLIRKNSHTHPHRLHTLSEQHSMTTM